MSLIGQHFTMTPLRQDSVRPVPAWPRTATWTWEVTPNRPGKRILYLSVLSSYIEGGRKIIVSDDEAYSIVDVSGAFTAKLSDFAWSIADKAALALLGFLGLWGLERVLTHRGRIGF
jgi:hypothetical protein